MQTFFIIFIIVINAVLTRVLFTNWQKIRLSQKGIFLAAIMLISSLFFVGSSTVSFNNMKKRNFCISCHEMQPYEKSLHVDHDDSLVSKHWQNNYVPKENACYSCHTEYSMFGGIDAKIGGIKHMFVHYTGTAPEKLKLYKKYSEVNCRHCHSTSKKFLDKRAHNRKKHPLKTILSGKSSCLTTNCHDVVHAFKSDED